jgi:OTU domain-containing protein 6
VTKGDRKKKKDIDTQIALLENEFEEKCLLEIKNLEDKKKVDNEPEEEAKTSSKSSKAKKRKEKKDLEAQKRDQEIALQEIENKNMPAAIELKKIKEKLLNRSLQIKDVHADGNCMYYAVSEQLKLKLSLKKSCDELRDLTGDFMFNHQIDFQPYLCSETDGEPFNDQQYEEYCNKIKSTLMWGGQLELRALSDLLNVKIIVIQSDSSDIIIGENYTDQIFITYHRHMFGSGEHYNSTEPLVLDDEAV